MGIGCVEFRMMFDGQAEQIEARKIFLGYFIFIDFPVRKTEKNHEKTSFLALTSDLELQRISKFLSTIVSKIKVI